jgi:hypothetical protein
MIYVFEIFTYDHLRGRVDGNIKCYKHTTAFGVEKQNYYATLLSKNTGPPSLDEDPEYLKLQERSFLLNRKQNLYLLIFNATVPAGNFTATLFVPASNVQSLIVCPLT